MSNSGWIKLHRKVLDSGWLQNHKLWTFWTYCLLKADHSAHKTIIGYQEIWLEPGQFIFGRKIAASELNMSECGIRSCLNFLKKLGNVTIKTTNKFSIITIVNWDVYQSQKNESDQQSDQQTTSKRPANDQPVTTHKKEKNVKNVKKEKRGGGSAPPLFSFKKFSLENIKKEFLENGCSDSEASTEAEHFLDYHASTGFEKAKSLPHAVRRWLQNKERFKKIDGGGKDDSSEESIAEYWERQMRRENEGENEQ